MNVPDYDRYFRDGLKLDTPGEPRSPVYLRLASPGELAITSGRLVACDPFLALPDTEAFALAVPPGRHRVTLCVIEYFRNLKPYDQRIALARVDFRKGPVTRWELATLPGQNHRKLGKDEFFGFVVESGNACFADHESAQELSAALEADDSFSAELEAALERNYQVTRSWASHVLDPESGANVVLFSSGDGAGNYPTFFGYDRNDRLAAALIDFLLISYA